MKSIFLLFLSLLIISCTSTTTIVEQKVKPELPIKALYKKGIAPISSAYKKKYPNLLPYLFYNKNNTFNQTQGDFYNVAHQELANVNIMAGYWKKFAEHKTSLIVLIAMTATSKGGLKNLPVTVSSSKYGVFEKGEAGNDAISKRQQRMLFSKKITIERDWDIVNKAYDDVITITIGTQDYTLLNPELGLK